MKNINFSILLKSLLIVLALIAGMFTLAFVLSTISQQTLFSILGIGAFGLLWYITYDILNFYKKQK